MSNRTYFKVVDRRGVKLYSACRASEILGDDWELKLKRHPFKLRYIPNRWRAPRVKGSCLFLFETYSQAQLFRGNYWSGGVEIWECEGQNVREPVFARPLWVDAAYVWKKINALRQRKQKLDLNTESQPWPEGTLCADAIKLTRLAD